MNRGHKCDYKKQINEELLDAAVVEILSRLVSNRKFAELMKKKINTEVDTGKIDSEIQEYERQFRQCSLSRERLVQEIDLLDYEDKHYLKKKEDIENRLYKIYDRLDELEKLTAEAKMIKRTLLTEKISGDNIYKALIFFDNLYEKMNEVERRAFMEKIVYKVHIHEERLSSGQWIKGIEFKLPIIEEELHMSLDNDGTVETVCLLLRKA